MNIIQELNKLRAWNLEMCIKKENDNLMKEYVEKSLYPGEKKTNLHKQAQPVEF